MLSSCDKFLDEKSNNVITIPNRLSDLRKLLDYEFDLNFFYPAPLEASTDNYYLTDQGYAELRDIYQSIYNWEDQGVNEANWTLPYRVITAANVVLESLERIEGGQMKLREQLEGEALFLRSVAFFYLAQVFSDHYSLLHPSEGLGIVLRLDSDVKITSGRASLKDTYARILTDLHRAHDLLPSYSEYITRPTKGVAAAILARIYLVTELFDKAEEMVDLALKSNNNLLDFNELNAAAKYPFSLSNNPELMYIAGSNSAGYNTLNPYAFIPKDLYDLYEEEDLRKVVFFEKSGAGVKFKGFYYGVQVGYFSGIAVDELYLIKAECLARRNETLGGTTFLNSLLRNRYKTDKYLNLSFENSKALLFRVLLERRKELIYRGQRWMDLRRLNIYPDYAVTLRRNITEKDGVKVYALEPHSKKYTFLIPWIAIKVSGYQQNER